MNPFATEFVPSVHSKQEPEAPSPAPIAPTPVTQPPTYQETIGGREWDDWVIDRKPSQTFDVNGIKFFLVNAPDHTTKNRIVSMVRQHGRCNECAERAKRFAFLIGADGSPFLNTVNHQNDGWHSHSCGDLMDIRKEIVNINKTLTEPRIMIVKDNCFPDIDRGTDYGEVNSDTLTPHSLGYGINANAKIKPFQHITINPDEYTPQNLLDKYERVINEYVGIIGPRMEKLCVDEAIDSVKIIEENLDRLERPGHWKSVIRWVKDIQSTWKSVYGRPLEHMSMTEKINLYVMAITSSESRIEQGEETVIHKSYKQSSNIVDFITLGPIEDVLTEMDIRSDPNNYMISQLTRRIRSENVTSKHTISLAWEGKYKDDLDIHIKGTSSNGRLVHIYYGNTSFRYDNQYTWKLDFDANASRAEAEPCENVSLSPGTFTIEVNNYRRVSYVDIPFSVIIRQEGEPVIEIPGIWPKDRRSGNNLIIKQHTFTEVQSKTIQMTEKQSNRARQLNSKWEDYFGTPESIIPSVEQMTIPVNIWSKPTCINQTNVGSVSFMSLASQSRNATRTKKYLSEIESDKKPDTLIKLLTFMSTGTHSLYVNGRFYTWIHHRNCNTQEGNKYKVFYESL